MNRKTLLTLVCLSGLAVTLPAIADDKKPKDNTPVKDTSNQQSKMRILTETHERRSQVVQKFTSKEASQAIAAAERKNNTARKSGLKLPEVDKIIKAAKKATQSGNNDEAVKLAKKAKKQADLAMAQYKRGKKSKPRF